MSEPRDALETMSVDLAMLLMYWIFKNRSIPDLDKWPVSAMKCQLLKQTPCPFPAESGSFLHIHLHSGHYTLWYYNTIDKSTLFFFDSKMATSSKFVHPDLLACAVQRVSHRPLSIVRVITKQQAPGYLTCGLHCIALAREVFDNPTLPFVTPDFIDADMAKHLADCFKQKYVTKFPCRFRNAVSFEYGGNRTVLVRTLED